MWKLWELYISWSWHNQDAQSNNFYCNKTKMQLKFFIAEESANYQLLSWCLNINLKEEKRVSSSFLVEKSCCCNVQAYSFPLMTMKISPSQPKHDGDQVFLAVTRATDMWKLTIDNPIHQDTKDRQQKIKIKRSKGKKEDKQSAIRK